jgi:cytochrome c-type biogenesis protein CcmF
MVGAYQEEKDVRMSAGETVSVGGYQIRLQDVNLVPGPNYQAMRGTFLLTKMALLRQRSTLRSATTFHQLCQ